MIVAHRFKLGFLALFVGFVANLALASDDFTAITSNAAFKKAIGNKTLVLGQASVTIKKNGKLSGTSKGKDFTGVWRFENGYFCRSLDNSNSFPAANCQTVEVNGNRARFTANQGSGTVRVWEIK